MPKQLLFSVTRKDFDMQTFSVGGPGGGGKDTSNSGVRLIHRESGAVGEGREYRTNTQNRKAAFERLVASQKFRQWHKIECARRMGQRPPETAEEIFARVDTRSGSRRTTRKIPETAEEIFARVDRLIADGLRDGSIVVEES